MRGAVTVSGKWITDEVMIYILICWGGIRLHAAVRLQFISTLCTTRCVTAVLNTLTRSVIESLCLHLEEMRFFYNWPSLLKRGWLVCWRLFGLRLRHHNIFGCIGCSLLSRPMHKLREPVSIRLWSDLRLFQMWNDLSSDFKNSHITVMTCGKAFVQGNKIQCCFAATSHFRSAKIASTQTWNHFDSKLYQPMILRGQWFWDSTTIILNSSSK